MKNSFVSSTFKIGAIAVIILGIILPQYAEVFALSSDDLNVWWPTDNAYISGSQPFKTMLSGFSVSQYRMFWQVDSGQWNHMSDDYRDYPHKEVQVDLTNWNWQGMGPYNVTFIATDLNGNKLVERTVKIYNPAYKPIQSAPTPIPIATATPLSIQNSIQTPIFSQKLYVNPNSEPKKWADANRWSRPQDAALMDKIANQPEVQWFGNWNWNIWDDVNNTINTVTSAEALPVFVIYNIPQRDCGGYSAGGLSYPEAYKSWVRTVADAVGNRKAMVIVEPDALAGMDCLSWENQQTRLGLIKDAIQVLKSKGNIKVYVDAGHPGWKSASDIADRLRKAGIDQADGFALNVSNFHTNDSIKNYGSQISSMVGGKHFVADTGRNGNGPAANNEWCNPWGRALGTYPTTNTDHPLIDAYLWVRGPSGSDGWCNGGPSAGTFWPEYGLDIARNAKW